MPLAGCFDEAATLEPVPGDEDEARELMTRAISEAPDISGMDASIELGGAEVLTLEGVYDNSTGEGSFDYHLDAEAMGLPADEVDIPERFSLYMSRTRATMTTEGFVYSIPLDDPSNPLAQAISPRHMQGLMANASVNVTGIMPLEHDGVAAVRLNTTASLEGMRVTAFSILQLDPPRVLYGEAVLPADAMGAAPGEDMRIRMTMRYGDDLTIEPSAVAERAAALAFDAETTIESPTWREDDPACQTVESDPEVCVRPGTYQLTWVFTAESGVSVDAVEVHSWGRGDPIAAMQDVRTEPPTDTFRLAAGEGRLGDFEVIFSDTDADGLVSPGDVFAAEAEGAAPPLFLLYDVETETHFVPGPATLLVVVASMGAALLVGRRRA